MRRHRSSLRALSLPSTPAAPGGGLSPEPVRHGAVARRDRLADAIDVVVSAFAVAVGAIALPTAVAYLSVASVLWLFSLFGR